MVTLAKSQDSEVDAPVDDDGADAPVDDDGADAPDMLDRVMQLFLLSEQDQTETDLDSFGLVLEKLAYGADLVRRAELSNQLAAASSAPSHLMRRMAFDNILVARPVLQYSQCLSEGDLETLASKLDQDYLLAIAHRLKLSTRVTDILVDRGDAKVHRTATANAGAEFSNKSIAKLYELAKGDAELLDALGQRPDLNPGIVKRLRSFVSDHVLNELKQIEIRVGSEPPESDDMMASDIGDDVEGTAPPFGEPAQDDADMLADTAAQTGDAGDTEVPETDHGRHAAANEKALTEFASAGKLDEAIACMSVLTRMDEAMVRHCLLKAELSALMVMCKATGFANITFKSLLTLRNSHSESTGAIDMAQTMQRYDSMQADTAKRIVQFAQKKNC